MPAIKQLDGCLNIVIAAEVYLSFYVKSDLAEFA